MTTTEEPKTTWRQVRIYDGEGNLKEIVEPVFDIEPKNVNGRKFKEHECNARPGPENKHTAPFVGQDNKIYKKTQAGMMKTHQRA